MTAQAITATQFLPVLVLSHRNGVFRAMIHLLNAVWKADYGDPSRKLVMLCLADMANKDGVCWPSVATIAKRCNLTKSPILRHLKALQDSGHITITHQFKDGSKTSNRYQVMQRGGSVDDTTLVASTTHRTTIKPQSLPADPKSMLTRPTQIPWKHKESRILTDRLQCRNGKTFKANARAMGTS